MTDTGAAAGTERVPTIVCLIGGPITQHDIDANADWGGIPCYECGQGVTEPGGEWVLSRPFTAYPYCATCLQPDPIPVREGE